MNLVVAGIEYATKGALDTFTQLHVARKLGPAMGIVAGLVDPANMDKEKALLTVLLLSHISDEDAEYVVKKCLSVVTRAQPAGGFAAVATPAGQLMFADITMESMLEIAIGVIEENLGDFFRIALARLDQEAQKS